MDDALSTAKMAAKYRAPGCRRMSFRAGTIRECRDQLTRRSTLVLAALELRLIEENFICICHRAESVHLRDIRIWVISWCTVCRW